MLKISTRHLFLAICFLTFQAGAYDVPTVAKYQVPRLGDALGFPKRPDLASRGAMVPPAAVRGGITVDIASRQQSRAFYQSVFWSTDNIDSGWVGDVGDCNAGSTSQAFKDRVVGRVNYFRAMAGVPADITLLETYNGKDQAAALIMSANNGLSHSPPPNWLCWTADGDEAAGNSNLAIGSYGSDSIAGYMHDDGANNAAVGHRRWILYPQTQQFGTGDIPGQNDHWAANALWVIDGHVGDPRPVVRDDYVAWPPPGHVPYQVVFPRWSFSYPDADFNQATVAMTQDGQSVPTVIESSTNGAGENSLVWVPNGLNPDLGSVSWPKPPTDTIYHVTISGVLVSGSGTTFSYDVTVFDPSMVSPAAEVALISGQAAVATGLDSQYTFTSISFAASHDLQSARTSPYGTLLGAENQDQGVLDGTDTEYSLIVSDVVASGSGSYHLAHPNGRTQYFSIDETFLFYSGSQLSFYSRLGWATDVQIAKVEISLDGGTSWVEVYSQAGDNSSGEGSFTQRSIDLSGYAGKTGRIRFVYGYNSGSFFDQTSSGVGFYVDNIVFANVDALSNMSTSGLGSATGFTFNSATAGDYILQVRAVGWSGYPGLEWGPVKTVHVLDPATDSDGDGIPDIWEFNNGLNPGLSTDANLDPDGDGATNLEEYQAGTDPNDPASKPDTVNVEAILIIINSILLEDWK